MASRYLTPVRLSDRRSKTPEGFLVCHDVCVARTGDMLYRAGEVDAEAGSDGVIRISRDAATLFHPDTIRSFAGKPITNDHPVDPRVTPDNFKAVVAGVMQDPRQGTGAYRDFLIADLVVMDKQAIHDVEAGKVELSLGYDADYETVAPGRGIQRNILGNHVAIVDRGRCGSRCAIGDQDMSITRDNSTVDQPAGFAAIMGKLFGAKTPEEATKIFADAAAAEEAAKAELEAKSFRDKATADIATLTESVGKLTEAVAALVAGKTVTHDAGGDDADEADHQAFKDAAPRLELLSPGFKVPTFDAATKPKRQTMRDRLTACKCQAIQDAVKTEQGRKAVSAFTDADGDFSKLEAAALEAAFIGASEVIKALNNAGIVTHDRKPAVMTMGKGQTPADLNKSNSEFWKN